MFGGDLGSDGRGRVHGLKMMMTNLCKAMGSNTIAVHDAVYSPSYYLLDTLVGNARTYVAAACSSCPAGGDGRAGAQPVLRGDGRDLSCGVMDGCGATQGRPLEARSSMKKRPNPVMRTHIPAFSSPRCPSRSSVLIPSPFLLDFFGILQVAHGGAQADGGAVWAHSEAIVAPHRGGGVHLCAASV